MILRDKTQTQEADVGVLCGSTSLQVQETDTNQAEEIFIFLFADNLESLGK